MNKLIGKASESKFFLIVAPVSILLLFFVLTHSPESNYSSNTNESTETILPAPVVSPSPIPTTEATVDCIVKYPDGSSLGPYKLTEEKCDYFQAEADKIGKEFENIEPISIPSPEPLVNCKIEYKALGTTETYTFTEEYCEMMKKDQDILNKNYEKTQDDNEETKKLQEQREKEAQDSLVRQSLLDSQACTLRVKEEFRKITNLYSSRGTIDSDGAGGYQPYVRQYEEDLKYCTSLYKGE